MLLPGRSELKEMLRVIGSIRLLIDLTWGERDWHAEEGSSFFLVLFTVHVQWLRFVV